MGAIYATALFIGWNSVSTIQPVIEVERTVFYRERAAGLYSSVPYALSFGAMEVPYVALQTLLCVFVTFPLIQFQWTAVKLAWYTLFMFLTFLYFTYFGMAAIAISPNQEISIVISSFTFSFWNLLCGFLMPQPVSRLFINGA